jgi:hypothetical protein
MVLPVPVLLVMLAVGLFCGGDITAPCRTCHLLQGLFVCLLRLTLLIVVAARHRPSLVTLVNTIGMTAARFQMI